MLYLASYTGTQPGWKGLVNRAIRFFTKSAYSHSEICLGDPFAGPVDCLTSAGTEGGVRIKRMQLNPDKWDVIALPHVSEGAAWHFLADNAGQPYDFIGCVRSVLPFVRGEHPRKWFCSEVCAEVMGITEAWRMHPGVLHSVAIHQNKNIGRAE
jgi:hypothetical protein